MDSTDGNLQDFLMKRISRLFYDPNLTVLFRMIAGGLFIYASIDKIQHPDVFADQIRNYQLLPDASTNFLALVLSWMELICGMALVFGIYLEGSSLILSGLLIIFILGLGSAMWRGLDIDCGCYPIGGEFSKVGLRRIIEDIILLVMVIQIQFADTKRLRLDQWLHRRNIS